MVRWISFSVQRAAPAALIGIVLVIGGCERQEPSGDVAQEDTIAGDVQEDAGATTDPIAKGREAYLTYCASCHGRDGTGDGPVAAVMTVKPADLTHLRAKHGGSFPVDSVYAYIDGRQDVQAHGSRTMPVWGNIWGEMEGRPVPEEDVDQRIRELVEYIRTIQEDSPATD